MRKTAIIISIAAALLTQVSCVGNKTEQSKTDTIAVSGPNKTAINDMSGEFGYQRVDHADETQESHQDAGSRDETDRLDAQGRDAVKG